MAPLFFYEVNIFGFWPKTMDYSKALVGSPWFDIFGVQNKFGYNRKEHLKPVKGSRIAASSFLEVRTYDKPTVFTLQR